MPWYIEALQPVIEKVFPEQRNAAEEFLRVSFKIFDEIFKATDTTPDLEFYFNIIEKAHKKFANNDKPIPLQEFSNYLFSLMSINSKVTIDTINITNKIIKKYIWLVQEEYPSDILSDSYWDLLSIKTLKEEEKQRLIETGYQVKVDPQEVDKILTHSGVVIPTEVKDYISLLIEHEEKKRLAVTSQPLEEPESDPARTDDAQLKDIIDKSADEPIIENFIAVINYCIKQSREDQKKHYLPFFSSVNSIDKNGAVENFIQSLKDSRHAITREDREILMSDTRLVLTVKEVLADCDYQEKLEEALDLDDIPVPLESLSKLIKALNLREPENTIKDDFT